MVQLKGKIKGIALAKAIQRITNARPATKPSQPYPPGVTSSSSPPKPRVTTILTPCTTVATYSFHTTTRSMRIGVGLGVVWETVVWHRPHPRGLHQSLIIVFPAISSVVLVVLSSTAHTTRKVVVIVVVIPCAKEVLGPALEGLLKHRLQRRRSRKCMMHAW